MKECPSKGPLPSWSVSLLTRQLREALPALDLAQLGAQIPLPPRDWLTADPGTKSRRRRKATRNANVSKRGLRCCRCGATERIELHHVVPLFISEAQGHWREVERATVDLCVTCHNLLEEALDQVLPITQVCHRWVAQQLKAHPEWLTLGERGIIESRVVRWALAEMAREPSLAAAYEQATRLFLKLELPLTDRRVLAWQLRRRLGPRCERCGAASGLLYIISLPFSFVPQALALGFDPLDPAVGATLCHPCARAYVHRATHLGDPETELATAIQLRTALLHDWLK